MADNSRKTVAPGNPRSTHMRLTKPNMGNLPRIPSQKSANRKSAKWVRGPQSVRSGSR